MLPTGSKIAKHYFKIFILSSLFWLFFISIALFIIVDCLEGYCKHLVNPPKATTPSYKILTRSTDQKNTENAFFMKWEAAPKVPPGIGLGEMGVAAQVPDNLKDAESQNFSLHGFNVVLSDLISLNRSLKDVRLPGCNALVYPELLPPTSIVIIFHNEAWSTLLRTLWSIINRSPRNLVEEIILVDDASTEEYLGGKLEAYVQTLVIPVKILRMSNRSGLIRARLLGAEAVKSKVITFLDAHCECTEGWLEPLLTRIALNRKTIASPIVDRINYKDFSLYEFGALLYGGFNVDLTFVWWNVPDREDIRREREIIRPLNTPAIVGGLFVVEKKYFFEIGSYDEGMEIWGGENIELSLRTWMCGGTLEIVPCSHVGHVFRPAAPYKWPGGRDSVILYNTLRIVEVWLGEYSKYFYDIHKEINFTFGDVSGRKKLKEKLQCKSFRWFLDMIFPEAPFPTFYYHMGEIINVGFNKCLDTLSTEDKVGLYKCHNLGTSQYFVFSEEHDISNDRMCLDYPGSSKVLLFLCHKQGGNQRWQYNITTQHITNPYYETLCLTGTTNDTILMQKCNDTLMEQKWIFPGTKNITVSKNFT